MALSEEYKKKLNELNLPLYVKVASGIHNVFNYDIISDDYDYDLGPGIYIVEGEDNLSTLQNIGSDHYKLKGIDGEFQIWMFDELDIDEIISVHREERLNKLLGE